MYRKECPRLEGAFGGELKGLGVWWAQRQGWAENTLPAADDRRMTGNPRSPPRALGTSQAKSHKILTYPSLFLRSTRGRGQGDQREAHPLGQDGTVWPNLEQPRQLW